MAPTTLRPHWVTNAVISYQVHPDGSTPRRFAPVDDQDEIGVLARELDVLLDLLRERNEEIQTLQQQVKRAGRGGGSSRSRESVQIAKRLQTLSRRKLLRIRNTTYGIGDLLGAAQLRRLEHFRHEVFAKRLQQAAFRVRRFAGRLEV